MTSNDRPHWLIFLAQLPASPSSARVALWRRLRAAGAASLTNGAWFLPVSDEHAALVAQLATMVRTQEGQAAVFKVQSAEVDDHAVIERFQSDRAREYAEFDQRCRALLEEIDKERHLEKFTFAELEEIEDDLQKLTAWLGKVQARDFFPGRQQAAAKGLLRVCEAACASFAKDVYDREGLGEPDEKNP